MFLLRLIHLDSFKTRKEIENKNYESKDNNKGHQANIPSKIINKDAINQIKNVSQEKKIKSETQIETKTKSEIVVGTFNELIDLCFDKKEMKLKYELEKNVNLVRFENGRIEISFNDNLDKDFVKDLSTKLFEWTNQRWIISFSKNKGEISIKDKENNKHKELINEKKKSGLYKTVLEYFPDAELVDVKPLLRRDDK